MPSQPVDQIVLSHLRITPLNVVFLTEEDWAGPAVKTPLLRSALGFHLRERECLTGAASCDGCLRKRDCWYATAFESSAETCPAGALEHGDRRVPHPFYMATGEMRLELERGTEMQCRLGLFGK